MSIKTELEKAEGELKSLEEKYDRFDDRFNVEFRKSNNNQKFKHLESLQRTMEELSDKMDITKTKIKTLTLAQKEVEKMLDDLKLRLSFEQFHL